VSHVVLPLSVLWRNRQTKVCLIFSPKPRNRHSDFEAQITKLELSVLRLKPKKTVRVVLSPNHSQTVDLGFEDQPRNPRSSSPHARCRPHIAPPDLSIARPLSSQPVRSFTVLCTRSPTPATIFIVVRHVAPATCTPRDKQTRFSNETKNKGKTIKMSQIRIQTSPSQ
jgi:hypothetical protein